MTGTPPATRRLGVMGGTFDPIHNGHLVAATQVAESMNLDRVVFVPTGHSWQKDEPANRTLLPAMRPTVHLCDGWQLGLGTDAPNRAPLPRMPAAIRGTNKRIVSGPDVDSGAKGHSCARSVIAE